MDNHRVTRSPNHRIARHLLGPLGAGINVAMKTSLIAELTKVNLQVVRLSRVSASVCPGKKEENERSGKIGNFVRI